MAFERKIKSKAATARLPDILSYFLIGSCILIIPFLISDRLLDPILSLRFTALSISLLIITLLIAISGNTGSFDLSILRRKIFLALIIYLGASALSLLSAINLLEGIFELLKIALMAIFIGVAAIMLLNTPNSLIRLTKAVIITAFISAVIGIMQIYDVAFNSLPGHFTIYSTMANKNIFSSFLFLTLPFSLYGFFYLRRKWDMAAGLASILSLWCIVLAASRAVWLAVLVGAIGVGIFCLYGFKRNWLLKTDQKRLAVRAAILLIAFFILTGFSYLEVTGPKPKESPLQEKVSAISSEVPGTGHVRIILWKKTLQMIADHPFLGVGLGNWKINIPRYGTTGLTSEEGRVHYIRPHNDFLWILAETGPLGLLGYLSLFIISFYYSFKAFSRTEDWEKRFFLLMVSFGIFGFGIISNFSFPKERIAHLLFISLLFVVALVNYHKEFKNTGIPSSTKEKESRGKQRSEKSAKSFAHFQPLLITSLVILAISCVIGYYRIRADAQIMKAYYYWNKKQWHKMAEEAEKAKSPFVNLDHNAAPFAWFQAIAYMSLKENEMALDVLKEADNVHPYHIQVLDNLATCYELLGDHDNAIKYFQRVLEISPRFENVLRNLSVIYYNMGEYKKAIETYSRTDIYSKNQTLFKYLESYSIKLNSAKKGE